MAVTSTRLVQLPMFSSSSLKPPWPTATGPRAQRRAWRLYLPNYPSYLASAPTWTAARRRLREAGARLELSPEARVGIARALCHYPQLEQNQDVARTAVDLCLANLHSRGISGPTGRRSYQASLLVLACPAPAQPL